MCTQSNLKKRPRKTLADTHGDILREMYLDKKMSINAIAAELGKKHHTVSSALKKLKIPLRSLSESRRLQFIGKTLADTHGKKICEMYEKKRMGTGLIAKKFGIAKSTVIYILKAKGVVMREQSEAIACQWEHDDGTRRNQMRQRMKTIQPLASKALLGTKRPDASVRMSDPTKNPAKNPEYQRKATRKRMETMKRLGYPDKTFHGGMREDLGIAVRSSWEANFARILNHLSIPWQYEPRSFPLDADGNKTYTPDFFLPNQNCYVEIKGRWIGDAKEKFLQFKEMYPDIKIVLINSNNYKYLVKYFEHLPNFEKKGKKRKK